MNFFKRRPLTLILAIALSVGMICAFLPGIIKAILVFSVCILTPVITLIIKRLGIREICTLPSPAFTALCSAAIIIFSILSYAYYDIYAARYHDAGDGRIKGIITGISSESSYNAVYKVKLYELNGEKASATGLIYTETGLSLEIGTIIEADVAFMPPEDFYEYSEVAWVGMVANGNVFSAKADGDISVLDIITNMNTRLYEYRELISSKMALYLDKDSAKLSSALLLGNRSELDKSYRDFKNIGIVHLLALSGTHLTIIAGICEFLLGKLHIKRLARYLILSGIIIFYTALTGFLAPVVRACLMLLICYIGRIIYYKSDRVTSLFVSVSLMALFNPSILFNVSLQLSFFSTLGVVLMIYDLPEHLSSLKILNYIITSVVASIGATLFVLPLQWLYFGEIAPLAIPATLILSFPFEILLTLLVPFALFSMIDLSLLASVLSPIIMFVSKICERISEKLANICPTVSLLYPFTVFIIIGCAAAILIMMLKNVKSWLYAGFVFISTVILFSGCVMIYNITHMDTATVDYINSGSNDALLIVSKRKAMLIDFSEGSSTAMYLARYELEGHYLTEIDTLMLTHLHRKHINSVRALFLKCTVGTIVVPSASDKDEEYIIDDLYKLATEYGTKLVLYSQDGEFNGKFGDFEIKMPKRTTISRSVHPLLSIKLNHNDTVLAYVGASLWENEYALDFVSEADYVIFGTNGPYIKSTVKIPNAELLLYIKDELLDFMPSENRPENLKKINGKVLHIEFKN